MMSGKVIPINLKRKVPRFVVSAAHKSSGKTVVSIGLAAAMTAKDYSVQTFKKGPDYIDPMWLSAAAGKECRNLDYHMLGWENISSVFKKHAARADISIVEGSKGLYDAVELDGEGSTATLARYIDAPVILVIDVSRITRGIAPLLLGYRMFDKNVNIAGVILNKIGNSRQESKLRKVVEHYTDIEILGCIRKTSDMSVLERHLGLVPIKEDYSLKQTINDIQMHISYSVDLDRIVNIASRAPALKGIDFPREVIPPARVKLGVMMDSAFTFYYPENLEALRMAGAELVPVDALGDANLPEGIDGLYIGGGFPEVLMKKLEKNSSLRAEIRFSIENGLPVYAECGGLIYLARTVSWNGRKAEMVGIFDCDAVIGKKPKGHGYMTLEPTGKSPWRFGSAQIRAHEFHYSKLVGLRNAKFAYRVIRGTGIDGKNDGIVYKNVLASYAHLHYLGCPDWAESFVSFAENIGYSSREYRKDSYGKLAKLINQQTGGDYYANT
ncbi:MAG: cobyrinate a,c-diamide synthase [bacterium]|nr:MAG: cobyrinate a,c-diamide synthase [bacterium]